MAATWIDPTDRRGRDPEGGRQLVLLHPRVAADRGGRPGSGPWLRRSEPGRIQLALELPVALAGSRKLRLAYQANVGTAASPEWRDLVLTEAPVSLSAEAPNTFRVEQERGRMEYSKKRMKSVETFALALTLDTPGTEP